jgi:TIR domain-containing protein
VPYVFISHRSADLDLARKLSAELAQCGNDVWLDDEKILPGDSIVGKIEDGLIKPGYFLLCLSGHGPSLWTDREWMSALARQLAGADVRLVPVFLTGGKIPAILADIKAVDLTKDWADGVDLLCKAIR